MRTLTRISLLGSLILLALVLTSRHHQSSHHVPLEIQTHYKTSESNQTNGDPTTSPPLDGTLGGYDLEKLAGTIDKPCPQWHTPFLLAGWDEAEWETARWIIYRESRCLQDAFNGVDAGLLQINEFHAPLVESFGLRFPDDLFDGETNLWVAYMLWLDYGWEPWIYKGVVPGE